VLSSLQDLELSNSDDLCRLAVLKHQMGDIQSLQNIHKWAVLNSLNPLEAWTCAFHPEVSESHEGVCPFCEAELVNNQFSQQSAADREAQGIALEALADISDPLVAKVAQNLLTSDAPSAWRAFAAVQWARINNEAAHPHVKLFLELEVPRLDVLYLVAEFVPGSFVSELQVIFDNEHLSFEWRLAAIRGLTAVGHSEGIDFARQVLNNPKIKSNLIAQHLAVELLAEFGNQDDIKQLKSMLESEHRIAAAGAILRILERV
jgi:hypothetical protein